MRVYVHELETLLPPYEATQASLARTLGEWGEDPVTARRVRHVFQKTGIESRHSVIPDFTARGEPELFRKDGAGRLVEPSTQERNRCYARHAGPMAVALARRLLANSAGFRREDITHLITVSCTGFVNPGPDFRVITELGLPGTVQRYHLGFMGCYAALPALRLARQLCQADAEAVVMVLCLELCTLHLQVKPTADAILANALFADGGAGALVSARSPAPGRPALALDRFHSALAVEGEADMAWEIGEKGFNLVLSSYVPDVIALNLEESVSALLGARGLDPAAVRYWAVHPGGRAILDKIEGALGLDPGQIAASREVLRECGNMSSVTLLFVLERVLGEATGDPAEVAAMAFGPGLTIESGLFQVLPARAQESPVGAAAAWVEVGA